jgi:sigma-54 dependent transcriptional regulator, acetoin dehydrogenase operon transcriptional activator AcoR
MMTLTAKQAISLWATEGTIKRAWEDIVLKNITTDQEVRPEIFNSWRQCLDIGLDPHSKNSPPILTGKKLQQLLRLNRDLIEISKPVMHMIEISVRSTDFIVTLSDKVGYVLKVYGDKEILKMADENYYVPGCLRSVQHAGTNAIGLCLDLKKPIQLTGAEHFKVHHHPWTCSSAPIHDSQGSIAGAITLSGRSIGRHQHTLALVTAAAETIDSQLRERSLIEEKQRLNLMLTSIYNSITEGILAIDTRHRITHVNGIAGEMLALTDKPVVGKPLTKTIHADKSLNQAITSKKYFDGHETSFRTPKGERRYICSVDPILNGSGQQLGTIIKLSEKRQMIKIAKRIGGNYAKYEFKDIKCNSPGLQRQIRMAKIAANTNSRILIIGESGTGKELFAHAIHSHSNRRNEPFVAVSCAAIPRDLIESELFGYRGGAFTGARRGGMMGKFEFADKGTLFLDEINSLPLGAQAKLLRVLQQNEIMRLGDNRTIAIDVRVIAASSVDLLEEVERDNFREDLYYRLNVVEIFIPPLRERIEDLDLLVDHITARQCGKFGYDKPPVSRKAFELMRTYDWPGNIRELENSIARALMLSQGHEILPEHLPMRPRKKPVQNGHPSVPLRDGYKQMIAAALAECDGNISKTARRLKIARSTLYRKMQEFGIS